MVVSLSLDDVKVWADGSSWIDEVRGTWNDLFREYTLQPDFGRILMYQL
jgi:hypothetical protein